MATLDLAVPQDLLQHLADGPFASNEVLPLTGGSGNYTYRLRLCEEYRGRKTLVLKHGKAYIPGAPSFPFALERQHFDQSAMSQVRNLLPEDSLVTIPEIHLYDEDASIIIMDDCGEDSISLKDLLKSGSSTLPLEAARKIGAALGIFLNRLHSWGEGNQQALDFFDGNKQARTISAWATYGRLVSTLSGANGLPALADPPLGLSPDRLELIAKIAQETTEAVHTARETVLMGDFWPGNVLLSLVQTDKGVDVERIFIIDWELVKPGLRGMDIGQFCAEMHQMRRFHPSTEPLVLGLVSEFLDTYRNASQIELTQTARVALTHMGAHLVAWTPRVGWGGKKTTREVALEGVQCLLDGYEGTQEAVDNSFIGQLTVSGHGQ